MKEVCVKRIFVSYVATLVVFAAIDFVWMSTMTGRLYQPVMDNMLIADFRRAPAVAYYLLCVIGLTIADLAWGTILSAMAAATSCLIAMRVFGRGESPLLGASR